MNKKWTPAQQAAMDTMGRTLLVSAAAGSGKTATLTQRIINRLTDPENPADLSRLLIVTFTRAAAAELRERIAGALTTAMAADPGNRHLQRQLIGLGSAHICTIDSFFREPVKAHFAELGLSAATRIADEAELAPMQERVMGEVMDEYYLKYASPEMHTEESGRFSLLQCNPFADLCDSLTSSKNDEHLIPTLLSLYEKLLSFPAELDRLRMQADSMETAAMGDFFESDHGRVICTWMHDFARSAVNTLDEALMSIDADDHAFAAYHKAFEADRTFCVQLADTQTYHEMYAHMQGYQNLRLGGLKVGKENFVEHKNTRTAIVKSIKTLRTRYFSDSPDVVCHQLKDTARMCRVLYDLLTEYDRRILSEKQTRGICDFVDNRRYLLHLLRNPDGTPTATAIDLAAQFDEVYIDEYQDVDEMQDEIFRLVGGDHRFMVGDIKQSIYGFRGADPSVFARYRRELPSLADDSTGQRGNSIFMSENFRCDEGVIHVTNAVCGHMFRACPDSVAYKSEDDLRVGKRHDDPNYRPTNVEISVLTQAADAGEVDTPDVESETATDRLDGESLSNVMAEAVYVANCIAELLRSGAKLENGDPIRPSDIAILMRTRTHLQTYLSALTAMGIPTGSQEADALRAGQDMLHGDDMMYLVNLLRVIDNPDSDIPLSEVLRAPFPGLDLEDVLAVRRVGEREATNRSLYACVEDYASTEGTDPTLVSKLAAFTVWIDRYRTLCATQSATGILRLLRQDERCACRHTDAFFYLYESARTCRTSSFVSLYAFLRYFESKLLTTKDVRVNEGHGGQVSLMTIHKSKGLEFPVCFVVRCGATFNARSVIPDLLFEKSVGIAMKLYRRADITDTTETSTDCGKAETTLRGAAALAITLAEREEEMRALYVAMTRARERLYLVGIGKETVPFFRAEDRYATLSATNYLRWILPGLKAHPDVEAYYDLRIVPMNEISPNERLPAMTYLPAADHESEAESWQALQEACTEPDAMETLLRRVPTKVSASGMHPHMLDTCVFYDSELPTEDGKLPALGDETGGWCDAQTTAAIRESLRLMTSAGADEFELLLGDRRRPTPTERGTANHLFLQYCDYGRVSDGITPMDDAIDREIDRLFADGFLNARTVEILDRRALVSFFESHFFAHVKTCVHIEREWKFSRFVPLATLTENETLATALGDRTLYVQGSIDLLCEFADGHLELCDYKTDRITPDEQRDPTLLAAHMRGKHGDQLLQYVTAVEEMYGRRPEHVYIYSLPLGEAVEVSI